MARTSREIEREEQQLEQQRRRSSPNRLLAAGAVAGAAAAAGYFLYRSGAFKDLIGGAVKKLSNYRGSTLQDVFKGAQAWSKRGLKTTAQAASNSASQNVVKTANATLTQKLKDRARYSVARTKSLFTELPEDIRVAVEEGRKARAAGKQAVTDESMDFIRTLQERAKVLVEDLKKEKNPSVLQRQTDDLLMGLLEDYNVLDPKKQAERLKKRGHRFATLGEARDAGLLDQDDISLVEQFAQGLANRGKSADEVWFRMADRRLLIDEAGKITDLRPIDESARGFVRSLAYDFKIPFVGFNPLQMFHVGELVKDPMPNIAILKGTTKQVNITGTANEMGNSALYAFGNVYNLFDEGDLKFGDILAEGGSLIDARHSAQGKYLSKMAGIPKRTFVPPPDNASQAWQARYKLGQMFDIGFQEQNPGKASFTEPMSWAGGATSKLLEWFPIHGGSTAVGEFTKDFGKDAKYVFIKDYKSILNTIVGRHTAKEYFGQFVAGRSNLKDVTKASLPFYAFFERLNATMSMANLGLSRKHTGSAFDLFKGFTAYRILPVVGGLAAWNYINYETEKLTGVDLDASLAGVYEGASVGWAAVRDVTGLTDIGKRAKQIFAGTDQITEIPGLGFLDWSKSAKETRDFWRHGEVPIRKGRYWTAGNTPFTGGRIDHYEPNWIRKVRSDWKYSDVLYGSKDEYWRNAPIPTPRYPMAPVRHFLTDPYHWEKKHYHDRPYPVTGGIAELEEFPLVGPALSATVGRVLKPPRTMHSDVMQQLGTSTGQSTKPPTTTSQARTAAKLGIHTVQDYNASKDTYVAGTYADGKFIDAQGRLARNPRGLGATGLQTAKQVLDMSGFYGFAAETVAGDVPDPKMLADSRVMTSYRKSFWDLDIGGLGGDINEIGRRFIGKREKWENRYNPIPNTMPDWLPGDDSGYFVNFRRGDAYSKIPAGELRLPGEAYERLYGVKRGKYTEIDKLRILGDVAPWSDEYKLQSKIVSALNLKEEDKAEAREIRKQVSARKQQMRTYDYRFNKSAVKHQTVTVTRVINNEMFMTEEYDRPLRFAGIKLPTGENDIKAQQIRDMLDYYIYPGARVKVAVDEDEETRVSKDTYKTIGSVVYVDYVGNLNRELIKRGIAKEKENDYSAAAVEARFSPVEKGLGHAWESFAHKDTPFHTKFLQVRSPLESYKRRDLYGKDWQSWKHPVKDFLKPTYESFISKGILFLPVAVGFGTMFGATPFGKLIGGTVAGVATAVGMAGRKTKEVVTGERWIPRRRQQEREIEEYMDRLKYVKYSRLFAEYANKAKAKGEDVMKNIKEFERKNEERLWIKHRLESLRETLMLGEGSEQDIINKVSGTLRGLKMEELIADTIEELRYNINQSIEKHSHSIKLYPESEEAKKAYAYYQEAKQTMYAYERGGNINNAIQALPKKDRKYFTAFLKAPAKERKEILEVVPDYMKRMLQASWGMTPDKKQPIDNYFLTHELPDSEWAGWREDVDLTDVKVKLVKKHKLDPSDFDIWEDDKEQAEHSPASAPNLYHRDNYTLVKQRLYELMKGAGVEDIDISFEPTKGKRLDIEMEIEQNREEEIKMLMNKEKRKILGIF